MTETNQRRYPYRYKDETVIIKASANSAKQIIAILNNHIQLVRELEAAIEQDEDYLHTVEDMEEQDKEESEEGQGGQEHE